jgi:fructokinase
VTARPVVTVIGEALVDLIPGGVPGKYRATPGGSPFNVAVGLARLGNRTSLMARFADDSYGRLLRTAAAGEGIDLRAAPRAAERATVATASVDSAAQATYEFDMDGTADWQWTATELHRLDRDTAVLHFGSIASWTPPGGARIADLVGELRATGGVLISYDPNIRPAALGARARGVEVVEDGVRRAHVVKSSREDVEWLYPDLAIGDAAVRWSELGAKLVIVTDGANGATAYRQGHEPLHRPGRPVTVVDTIGAGDAFTAGLLSGFMRRRRHPHGLIERLSDGTLADVVDEAVLVAAITCERAGADPPRLDELPARLRNGPAEPDGEDYPDRARSASSSSKRASGSSSASPSSSRRRPRR